MIFRIFLLIVGMFLVLEGWREFFHAYQYREPVHMTCKAFVEAVDKPDWVSVDDCTVYLGMYQASENVSDKRVVSMSVLVFPSDADAENAEYRTSVILSIQESLDRDRINGYIEQINALRAQNDPSKQQEINALKARIFLHRPLILMKDSSYQGREFLEKKLVPVSVGYRYSTQEDNPPYIRGLVIMLVAGAVCLYLLIPLLVPLFIRIRAKKRSKM